MPYINVTTNRKIPENVKLVIKTELGKIIEIIPGKTEKWLMVSFQDEQPLFFGGDGESTAVFTTLKAFGHEQTPACYDALTAALTQLLSAQIGATADHIYVEYETTTHWGWNGKNF